MTTLKVADVKLRHQNDIPIRALMTVRLHSSEEASILEKFGIE